LWNPGSIFLKNNCAVKGKKHANYAALSGGETGLPPGSVTIVALNLPPQL
jgi:hypothetical protein